jgi:uncharacterized protein (TIGR03435 family)
MKGIVVLVAVGALAAQTGFEAATVKVSAAQDTRSRMRGGPGTGDPGQITYTNVTLASVLLRAYDVKAYQVAGPVWITSRRYDIAAKIPAGATMGQFRGMLQGLVAERFQLGVHHERRELLGYSLVTGKSAPKLKASTESGSETPAGPPKTDANGFPELEHPGLALMEGVKGKAVVTFLTARGQALAALVDLLSREFRVPVVDKTELQGTFDFKLEFAPQAPGALPRPPSMDGSAEAIDESGPNLMTAVQQQLGLRLVPGKIAVDVVVVDRGNPTPVGN